MGVKLGRQAPVEATNEFSEQTSNALEETHVALQQAASGMACFYDTDHCKAEEFQIGDQVQLDGRHIKTQQPMRKFDDRWFWAIPNIESTQAQCLPPHTD